MWGFHLFRAVSCGSAEHLRRRLCAYPAVSRSHPNKAPRTISREVRSAQTPPNTEMYLPEPPRSTRVSSIFSISLFISSYDGNNFDLVRRRSSKMPANKGITKGRYVKQHGNVRRMSVCQTCTRSLENPAARAFRKHFSDSAVPNPYPATYHFRNFREEPITF